MSDQATEAVPTESAEIAVAPVVDGQGEVPIEATPEAEPAPEPEAEAPTYDEADFLNTEELGSRPVRIKVNGEEQVVPLSEVLSGYNSNAAATKRFQEAAQIREEAERQAREADDALTLARALSNDPGMTMRVLASRAGLSVEQFLDLTPAQQTMVAEAQEETPQFESPLEAQLYEERQARLRLEQRIAAQEEDRERERANAVLQGAVGQLRDQFGATDEDVQSVVRQAWEMRAGPEMFPMIFQSQQYQKSLAQGQARQAAEAARAAEEAQRRAAAAAAQGQVSTGTGAVGTAPEQVVRPRTAAEAIASTLDQLGVG